MSGWLLLSAGVCTSLSTVCFSCKCSNNCSFNIYARKESAYLSDSFMFARSSSSRTIHGMYEHKNGHMLGPEETLLTYTVNEWALNWASIAHWKCLPPRCHDAASRGQGGGHCRSGRSDGKLLLEPLWSGYNSCERKRSGRMCMSRWASVYTNLTLEPRSSWFMTRPGLSRFHRCTIIAQWRQIAHISVSFD